MSKGSKRRQENFKKVNENWDFINWKSNTKQLFIRNKIHNCTPFDIKFINGQNKAHNIFSNSGHDWNDKGSDVRTCVKCFLQECSPPNWTPIPHTHFSMEDVQFVIDNDLKF